MEWTNSYRSFGLKTKRSTGLKTIEHKQLSVTHDNGTGFARHARLRDEPGMATYFADPYSSWQRGGNENRNGMIRRYLPKRTIIEPGMARELQEIVDETDNRPMRALGYRTPAEAFADELPDLQL